jgi:hypothetical protein
MRFGEPGVTAVTAKLWSMEAVSRMPLISTSNVSRIRPFGSRYSDA